MRLTDKDTYTHSAIFAFQKLGKLEDILEKYNIDSPELLDKNLEYCHKLVYEHGQIEEEFGIDLATLFKALKNGVFMSTKHFDVVYCPRPKIVHYKCGWKILVYGATLSLTTYGKTWALTKEELE